MSLSVCYDRLSVQLRQLLTYHCVIVYTDYCYQKLTRCTLVTSHVSIMATLTTQPWPMTEWFELYSNHGNGAILPSDDPEFYEVTSYVTQDYNDTENSTKPDFNNDLLRPDSIHVYLNIAFMSIFMIVGTLGNLVVLSVYTKHRRRKQSTANYFLCSLAMTDFLVCTVVIPMHVHIESVTRYRPMTGAECKSILFLWHQTMLCSSWILVGISIDRYYCLCKPLDMATHARRAKVMLVIIWIFSFLTAIKTLFMYQVPECRIREGHRYKARIIMSFMDASITLIIPIAIISVAYLRIFCILANRTLHAPGSGADLVNRTRYIVAKRLLLVIIAFILCWLPRAIIDIYIGFDPSILRDDRLALTVYVCRYIFPYLNSVMNPFLYSLVNAKFRKECWVVICCCCARFAPPKYKYYVKYTKTTRMNSTVF